jgi:hypothetical protein
MGRSRPIAVQTCGGLRQAAFWRVMVGCSSTLGGDVVGLGGAVLRRRGILQLCTDGPSLGLPWARGPVVAWIGRHRGGPLLDNRIGAFPGVKLWSLTAKVVALARWLLRASSGRTTAALHVEVALGGWRR